MQASRDVQSNHSQHSDGRCEMQSDDLIIERLRVKAARSDQHVAINELQITNWPNAGDNAWVFIRELTVRAPRSWLGIRARAAVRHMTDVAVHGCTSNADQAQAVRFENLAELLAKLSVDLIVGHAANRWFWRHWAHLFKLPASEAVRVLWDEYIAYLPSITERLAATGELSRVWQSLLPSHMLQLQTALCRHTQTMLPLPSAASAGYDFAIPSDIQTPPQYLQARWRSSVETLQPWDPRRWLAAALVVLEWRPLLLKREPELTLRRVSTLLTGHLEISDSQAPQRSLPHLADAGHPVTAEPIPARFDDEPPTQAVQGGNIDQTGVAANQTLTIQAEGSASTEARRLSSTNEYRGLPAQSADDQPPHDTDTAVESAQRQSTHKPGSMSPRNESSTTMSEDNTVPSPDHSAKTSTQATSASPSPITVSGRTKATPVSKWITQTSSKHQQPNHPDAGIYAKQGGVFYLINFLSRPEVTELLEPLGGMQILPDGWSWLYRLGLELGLEPDGVLARFFARCMGLEDIAELANIPPLPAREELLGLGQRLYADSQLWNETLLDVSCWIQHTPSHVDVYLPLSAVRLPVRCAGLDINPGWVPWLGRVVTFFYRDSPQLRTEGGQ